MYSVVIALIVLPYLVWSSHRFGLITPSALFALTNGMAAVSTLALLDHEIPADAQHARILGYTIVAFCLASFVIELRVRPPRHRSTSITAPNLGMIMIVALCVVVVFAYYWLVGYSALLDGIRNAATDGDQDIAGRRLESYAGSRLLLPGYVNQFKNALLPSLVVVIATYLARRRRYRLGLSLLALFSLFALVGTAQRNALVLFGLAGFIYLALYTERVISMRAIAFGAAVFGVLMATTFALGREPRGSNLLDQILERATSQAAFGKVIGFRYIYYRGGEPWGGEWLDALSGLLPRNRGSTLPNEIFALLYGGSTRGNSPPSLWASVYHNFGIHGIILIPVVFAVLFAWLTRRRSFALEHATTATLIGIAGVTACVGMWTVGSPVTLLNNGVVVYGLLWYWGQHHGAVSGRAVGARSATTAWPAKRLLGAGASRRSRVVALGGLNMRGGVPRPGGSPR